jgi:hypothetical protein
MGSNFSVDNTKKGKMMLKNEKGAIGWILLWALGIPIPLLLLFFLVRGCT